MTRAIGIPIIHKNSHLEVYVQLSKSLNENPKFIRVNGLLEGLNNDPDLGSIPPSERAQGIQTLYISSGCDYVSFFQGMGKITFLQTFFRYASFILGKDRLQLPGSIGGDIADSHNHNCMSFLRLDGCAYFRAHVSAFVEHTPESLFSSINDQQGNMRERHNSWLQSIRQVVWERTDSESQTMPSTESLLLHWKSMGDANVAPSNSQRNCFAR